MECPAKHTKYQPKDEDWKCPKCGVATSYKDEKEQSRMGFIIDESDPLSTDVCNLVHQADDVCCYACGYFATGKRAMDALAKKNNLKPCEHCEGA